jgi:hypothetical protein
VYFTSKAYFDIFAGIPKEYAQQRIYTTSHQFHIMALPPGAV